MNNPFGMFGATPNGSFNFAEAFNFFPMIGTGFSWSFQWPPAQQQPVGANANPSTLQYKSCN